MCVQFKPVCISRLWFEKTPVCVIGELHIFGQVFNPWYQKAKNFEARFLNQYVRTRTDAYKQVCLGRRLEKAVRFQPSHMSTTYCLFYRKDQTSLSNNILKLSLDFLCKMNY